MNAGGRRSEEAKAHTLFGQKFGAKQHPVHTGAWRSMGIRLGHDSLDAKKTWEHRLMLMPHSNAAR